MSNTLSEILEKLVDCTGSVDGSRTEFHVQLTKLKTLSSIPEPKLLADESFAQLLKNIIFRSDSTALIEMQEILTYLSPLSQQTSAESLEVIDRLAWVLEDAAEQAVILINKLAWIFEDAIEQLKSGTQQPTMIMENTAVDEQSHQNAFDKFKLLLAFYHHFIPSSSGPRAALYLSIFEKIIHVTEPHQQLNYFLEFISNQCSFYKHALKNSIYNNMRFMIHTYYYTNQISPTLYKKVLKDPAYDQIQRIFNTYCDANLASPAYMETRFILFLKFMGLNLTLPTCRYFIKEILSACISVIEKEDVHGNTTTDFVSALKLLFEFIYTNSLSSKTWTFDSEESLISTLVTELVDFSDDSFLKLKNFFLFIEETRALKEKWVEKKWPLQVLQQSIKDVIEKLSSKNINRLHSLLAFVKNLPADVQIIIAENLLKHPQLSDKLDQRLGLDQQITLPVPPPNSFSNLTHFAHVIQKTLKEYFSDEITQKPKEHIHIGPIFDMLQTMIQANQELTNNDTLSPAMRSLLSQKIINALPPEPANSHAQQAIISSITKWDVYSSKSIDIRKNNTLSTDSDSTPPSSPDLHQSLPQFISY